MCGNKLALANDRSVGVLDVGTMRVLVTIMLEGVKGLGFVDEMSLYGYRGNELIGWDLTAGGTTIFEDTLDTNYEARRICAIVGVGSHIAVGGSSGLVKVWKNDRKGALGQSLRGHTDQVVSLASARAGVVLVSSSADKTIRTWDVAQGECMNVLSSPVVARTMSFLESKDAIVYGGVRRNTLTLMGLDDGAIVETIEGLEDWVFHVTTDRCRVVCAFYNGSVEVWEGEEDMNPECTLKFIAGINYSSGLWVGDDFLISVDMQGLLRIWDFLGDGNKSGVIGNDRIDGRLGKKGTWLERALRWWHDWFN